MKMIKRRFEKFLFYDYTGVERHLEKMAREGWQLSKINWLYWEYHKAEPQELHYTVTYFFDASEYNPYPTPNQLTFYEYCEEAGWELVAEWSQMQIFCSKRENPTPIETDEAVKLKEIHRVMKSNFLPSNVLILLLSMLQVYLQVRMIILDPMEHLSQNSSLLASGIWVIIVIQTLFGIIGYAVWYQRSQKAVRMGGLCLESGGMYKKLFYIFAGVVLLMAAFALFMILFPSRPGRWIGLLGVADVMAVVILVYVIKNALKRAKISRKVNLTVTAVACVILPFLLTGVMIWCIITGINAGWLSRSPYETYTMTLPNGETYTRDIYHDPIPLKIEDLQEVDYAHYSYEWTEKKSLILTKYEAWQDPSPDGQPAPGLHYQIVDVRIDGLFDTLLDDYLDMHNYRQDIPEKDRNVFRQIEAPAWQVDKGYQCYHGDEALGEYIFCRKNRIIYVRFDDIPTEAQIAIMVEKLGEFNDKSELSSFE